MAKIPRQGGGGSDWGHQANRRASRGRGGDPHAKWNGGPKKSWFSCGVIALAGVGVAAAVLTDLYVNYI